MHFDSSDLFFVLSINFLFDEGNACIFLKENVDYLFCFLMYWELSMVHKTWKFDYDQRDRRHLA